jgi:ribosome-binding protein aMBF1 (putative translation factor)
MFFILKNNKFEVFYKMAEECIRCGVTCEEVRLYDAIYEGSLNLICERCSIIENIPIIKKPNYNQLKELERRQGLSGSKTVSSPKKQAGNIKEKLQELDSDPRLEMPENKKFNLVPNFHWEIMKGRRRKGYSQRQIADIIGEDELSVQMIEKGIIPESTIDLIIKLEQILQIKLRKDIPLARKGPILLDEDGKELDFIPEPVIECRLEIEEDTNTPLVNNIPVVKCSTNIKTNDNHSLVIPINSINDRMEFSNAPWRKQKKAQDNNEVKDNIKPETIVNKPFSESPFLKRVKEREEFYKKIKDSDCIDVDNEVKTFSGHIDSIKAREEITNRLKGKEEEKVNQLIKNTSPDKTIKLDKIESKIDDWELSAKDLDRITIDDLRRIHKKRIDATKKEMVEEQNKIVERQKMIEARKEELRIMKEKESKDIDSLLGGKELLRGGL